MSNYFPQILLPEALSEFYKDWKNNIDKYIEPQKPEEPGKPKEPEPVSYKLIEALGAYIFVGVVVFASSRSIQFAIIGLLVWMALYTIYYLSSVIKYSKKRDLYRFCFENYKRDFSTYKTQMLEYQKQIDQIKNLKNDINWLEQKRLETTNLLMTVNRKADIDYCSRKGASENKFAEVLFKYFGNLISSNRTTEVFSYYQREENNIDYESYESSGNKQDNAYVPDFVFTHDKSNMIIDIEIDEPYTFTEPIHTIGNEKDKKRNQYFTSINWFVIRFSERQIVKHPENCCREIALLIKDYTGDASFLNKIENSVCVARDRMWSYETAKNYATNKLRKKYEMLLTTEINEELILGKWNYNRKEYVISSDKVIVETDKLTNTETDKGRFILNEYPCGRMVMTVKWQKSQTKYFLNAGWNQDLILMDVYSRNQVTFDRG